MPQLPLMLIVDDDPGVLRIVERFARAQSLDVVTAASGEQALDILAERSVNLALVDIRMPGADGLQVLRALRTAAPDCRVILMTGEPSMAVAVEAIKQGAEDVLGKPVDFARLAVLIEALRDDNTRLREARAIDQRLAERLDFHGMIGRSAALESLLSLIRRLAPYVRAAVITGETGSGKELVARALHACGPRAGRPMVTLNCAAIVPTLFESELFGHARGAFTGATEHKAGVFEAADRGTLFLDEIGELPLDVQSKLLRVLERGETRRVGASETRTVDVHIIAATNRDLAAEVTAGRFRADLFYRLQVVELRVPPLRERREDIPLLAAGFVKEFAGTFRRPLVGLRAAAEQALLAAPWPGNIRQLRNVIERACLLAEGEWITEVDVGDSRGEAGPEPASRPPAPPLRELERTAVMAALRDCGGNKTHAAVRLGVSRRALYRLIEAYGLADLIAPAPRT